MESKIIGKKIGSMTVIGVEPTTRSKAGKARYRALVECECGVKKSIPSNAVYRADLLSCGCKRLEMYPRMTGENHYKFGGFREIRKTFWEKVKRNADSRSLPFEITIEYAWDLYESQQRSCALSGVPIAFGTTTPLRATSASIDRIDNERGYLVGNIQWVHKQINLMRGQLTIDEFRNWCGLVQRNK